VDVVGVAAAKELGLSALQPYLGAGQTVCLLGSSGVGKSTMVNALVGKALQRTQEVRVGDGKGRHTTVRRELIAMEAAALLIDTPGMRELALWDAARGVETTFEDVESFAENCRYRDCAHKSEPGCRVRSAVSSGELSVERLESYQKQLREQASQDKRGEFIRAKQAKRKAVKKAYRERAKGDQKPKKGD
ncbi:MAG: ribosome small subunit-dependent GTPase A, partial [Candidatus Marinimicrobia bacterium]|nr:ribosome small subunit-dependent GTPase A [Candidatus Neomarinimicrobiota bacterium]